MSITASHILGRAARRAEVQRKLTVLFMDIALEAITLPEGRRLDDATLRTLPKLNALVNQIVNITSTPAPPPLPNPVQLFTDYGLEQPAIRYEVLKNILGIADTDAGTDYVEVFKRIVVRARMRTHTDDSGQMVAGVAAFSYGDDCK